MNQFLFNVYLSFWQRLPIALQNKITDKLRYKFNVSTLTPKLPRAAVIDPLNICNLDCPLCASKNQIYDKSKMSFETFKVVLDKIPSLRVLVLFNWGEPLLHPEIFQMIKESVSRNIYTITHSHFSLKQNYNFFEGLVSSGLHQLVISADGASQETYEKYRVKGRFDWVIENIKHTVAAKKNLRKRDPKIIWKFLVNKYNEHEIKKAKSMARELGVEITFDKMGLADDLPDISFPGTLEERKKDWLPKNPDYILDYYKNENKLPINDKPCYQLFTSAVINPDGKVTPCCWVTSKENVWGDLTTQSFEEIWHGENYKYSRNLFNSFQYSGNVKQNICTKCEIFKRVK
ncbi:MAG: radical SAM protein [Bacteroidetes bacterium]|nr:radical SAM protein [Bacteroidota bacterium]MBU2586116.1 radical SAM protein [Bacteroidota bacterium]